ncbi:MAG: ABC transporter permease [Sedimentibacter sp.]
MKNIFKKDVLFQFLIESATLSAIGGIVGTMFGIGLVMIGGSIISLPIVVNPASIVIAVAFSMIIGVFFGIILLRRLQNQIQLMLCGMNSNIYQERVLIEFCPAVIKMSRLKE